MDFICKHIAGQHMDFILYAASHILFGQHMGYILYAGIYEVSSKTNAKVQIKTEQFKIET